MQEDFDAHPSQNTLRVIKLTQEEARGGEQLPTHHIQIRFD